ncbi:MAG: hypothetical protein Q4C82_02115 [Eubacteriales bacterium]|nr:hypothetical protein [Eubacteriales bacterium]
MEKMSKKYRFKGVAAAAAVCIMLFGSATAVYAADVGGIQRTLQLWIHGDQTEATIWFDGNGQYDMDYTDEDGTLQQRSGGGVAFAADGSEIPVTEEDLMAQLTAPEVVYEDDGTVWVYWFDQKMDITDKFENGVCYVKLVREEETLYLTVQYQNGYALSSRKYPAPDTFN